MYFVPHFLYLILATLYYRLQFQRTMKLIGAFRTAFWGHMGLFTAVSTLMEA